MPPSPEKRSHTASRDRTSTAYPRRRAAAACQVCRSRRTKCDNERPCSSCRNLGVPCSLEPLGSTAGFDAASLHILAKIEELHQDIRALPNVARSDKDLCPILCQPENRTWQSHVHLQGATLRQVLQWDVWGTLKLPHMLPCVEDSSSQTSSARSGDHDDTGQWITYLDRFFENVHVKNPILDEALIRRDFSAFMLRGPGWDAISCFHLLILANGAVSSRFGRTQDIGAVRTEDMLPHSNEASTLFQAAEKRLGALPCADHLLQARCFFYIGVYYMAILRPMSAWRFGFLQGVCAFQPSLARSKLDTPNGGSLMKQAEDCVYWSCWKSERELRFELELPDFDAAQNDHPVEFPSLGYVYSEPKLRPWYFYLAEISLWRIETKTRKKMTSHTWSSLSELADVIPELEQPILSWMSSLPDAIRFDTTDAEDEVDILRFVLRGRLTYNYEVLTWPFLSTLIVEGGLVDSRAMDWATRGIQMHYDRLRINQPGFYYRHHGTWLMQRSSARSACVLLAVARRGFGHLLPDGWSLLVLRVVEMLQYWGDVSDDGIASFIQGVLANANTDSIEGQGG